MISSAAMGWYEPDSPRPQTLRNLAVSLNLEAAEVLEHFQWDESLKDPQSFSDELADVMLYLLQLASMAGIDLEKAVLTKLEKNYHRTWDATGLIHEPFASQSLVAHSPNRVILSTRMPYVLGSFWLKQVIPCSMVAISAPWKPSRAVLLKLVGM